MEQMLERRATAWKVAFVVVVAAAAAVTACGAVLGIDDPELRVDEGDAALPPTDEDAPTSVADAGDAGPKREVDVEHGIFVSARSGDDTPSCGSIAAPCRTVQKGIDVFANGGSAAGKTTVYVGSARYDESITLADGVIVEGGWDVIGSSWLPSAPGTRTVIAATTNDRTVVAMNLARTATLRALTIRSKAKADVGESLYGVFASGGDASAAPMLRLDSVTIEIAEGGEGATGDASTGVGAPVYASGCNADNGAQGDAGTIGAGAEAGTFGSDGYAPTNGGQGNTGASGHAGTDGGPGQTKTDCVICSGNTGLCKLSMGTGHGYPGLAGCGGGGGPGGYGGYGGGASVGVYVWSASVVIAGAHVTCSAGGKGGSGGEGGLGSAGTEGAVPEEPNQCNPTVSCSGCPTNDQILASGTAGGTGGPGGRGGIGGGGAGGPSCPVVLVGGAQASMPSTTLVPGPGGTSTNGAPGMSAEVCP